MLKIKQYFCGHDFVYLAEHKRTSQNLWQCSKCKVFYIQHWGMGIGYKCKEPNLTGWKYYKRKW